MTKKNTAAAKANETKANPQDKVLALKTAYESAIKAARSLKKRAKKGDVTNFVTGRPVNRDEEQVKALKIVAAVEGYPTNEWATKNQIAANGGKLKAEAYGAPMFMPRGGGKFSYYLVYNKAVVDWGEKGEPKEFVKPTKAKKATKKAASRATKAPKLNTDGLIPMVMPNGATLYLTLEQVAALK